MEELAHVTREVGDIAAGLEGIDAEAIARQTGALKRRWRKLPMEGLLHVVVALSSGGAVTLEGIASLIELYLGIGYSKQALAKRLAGGFDSFLLGVTSQLFSSMPASRAAGAGAGLRNFRRVLVHDSTSIALPDKYAEAFPGPANGRKKSATLKIQLVMDILSGTVPQLGMSGFTRNDQSAAPDILEVAAPGDLVLRDLGYFALATFEAMDRKGIHFLSRYRSGTQALDPGTGETLDLAAILAAHGHIDRTVLLGATRRLPLRLVAVPVPEAVANKRRRQARNDRDLRANPSKEKLFLMGWSIFITNVTDKVWTPQQIDQVYRLRWSIEIVFKAWKSQMEIHRPSTTCEYMLRASIAARLIFCALLCRMHASIEMLAPRKHHASILRVAKIAHSCFIVFLAAFLDIPLNRLLKHIFDRHAYYERRPDRTNLQEQIAAALG